MRIFKTSGKLDKDREMLEKPLSQKFIESIDGKYVPIMGNDSLENTSFNLSSGEDEILGEDLVIVFKDVFAKTDGEHLLERAAFIKVFNNSSFMVKVANFVKQHYSSVKSISSTKINGMEGEFIKIEFGTPKSRS